MDQILVQKLKSPADFKDELNLTSLSTQMVILKHLQDNLLDYQHNFVKSFMMTFQQVLDYIPEDQHEEYFSPYCYESNYKHVTEVRRIKMKLNQKFTYFFVDTVNRKLYPLPRNISDLSRWKFATNAEATILNMTYKIIYDSYSQGFGSTGKLSQWYEISKFKFDMEHNKFIGFSYVTKQKTSSHDVGFYDNRLLRQYNKANKKKMFRKHDSVFEII